MHCKPYLIHVCALQDGPILTTIGPVTPLTFERFRICELYAELLHCSNMSLLNRSSEYDHLYDAEGRLRGGLTALEELARVIAIGAGNGEPDDMDAEGEGMEPAQELPVSTASGGGSSSLLDSDEDEDMSDDEDPSSSDDEVMEEIAMHDEPSAATPPISPSEDRLLEQPPLIVPSSPNAASLPSPSELAAQGAALARSRSLSCTPTEADRPSPRPRSNSSRPSLRRMDPSESRHRLPLPTGDKLKHRFTETRVLSTLLVSVFHSKPSKCHSRVYLGPFLRISLEQFPSQCGIRCCAPDPYWPRGFWVESGAHHCPFPRCSTYAPHSGGPETKRYRKVQPL